MAQKAAKSLATRNTARLRTTHLITAILNALFLLLRFTLLRSRSLKLYLFLCLPAFVIEFYLHILGAPTFATDGSLKRSGEDLEAKGLTEYMWDVVYWTWINLLLVAVLGNWAWWLYLVVPGYSAYAIATTVGGIKGMISGAGGAGGAAPAAGESDLQSNRQKKIEKRGGQKTAYR